jgi:hypothetical protein
LHPKVSTKPGRLSILEGLFQTIRQYDDVWVARGNDVADWWIQQYGQGGNK